MRLPLFLRRPEAAPVSPRMQVLQDRARELHWEVVFQRGDSPQARELDEVNSQIAALRLDEGQEAAAVG
ncbi:hypothetical protein [Kitasatospora sp. GP82]|uniref:hypothetical protein n=1 Tax=Kitasatospora sp. GP82 TaxID=3035089 RepID=UPI0024757BDE|nr:hypothetical protein [Kitasatospora sp. GP82]MDH6130187.1 hypothetical protein [Kitasatospora sp. GP82]